MTQQYPVLYSFRRCPYAMRARLVLALGAIQVEVREIDLKNKAPEFLELSPKGTVPVLDLGKGKLIDESAEIVEWAAARPLVANNLELIGDDEIAKGEQSQTLLDKFIPLVYRYKYPERYEDDFAKVCRQIEEILTRLALSLDDNNSYSLVLPRFCAVDILWLPFIRQFYRAREDSRVKFNFPAILRWLDTWEKSSIFNLVIQRYPVWDPSAGECNYLLPQD